MSMKILRKLLDNYANEIRKARNYIADGGWSGIRGYPDKARDAIVAAFDAQAARIGKLQSILPLLVSLREALSTLPMDALGEGRAGQLIWPIRDELINDLTFAIQIMESKE